MSTLSFADDLDKAMPREWLAKVAALPGQSEASVTALLADIGHRLRAEFDAGLSIYPPIHEVFSALMKTPPEQVRVVLLGQDPYHGGQAHGLCFSVRDGHRFPPTLKNIFRELTEDIGVPEPATGDLTSWADQGVLLLNSFLTVRAGSAGSHEKLGWGQLTDLIMQAVSEECQPSVFILWGNFASSKKKFINEKRHLIIESPHPSPLSSYRGFIDSKPFSRCNQFLCEQDRGEVNWTL
ncbi:MAG: uracil-DNA glycosylase [Proteobacteria bacterium]|nr:uracil-DNA glycosylase [Pseudomonadota bacterium]